MAWRFYTVQGDYVSVADNAALTLPGGDWTLAGWFQTADLAGLSFCSLISHAPWTTPHAINMYVYGTGHGSAGKLKVRLTDSAGTYREIITTGASYCDATWRHVVLCHTGDKLYLHLDGAIDPAGGINVLSLGAIAPSADMRFGRYFDGSGLFDGNLAEWAKWDRALSAGEITMLAAGHSPLTFAGGLAWHAPMWAGDYSERIAGLSVTNSGSDPATGPPIVEPRTAIANPLQLVG